MKKLLLLSLSLFCIQLLFAQNVGIGTNNPAEMLEVNGNIRLSYGGNRTITVTAPTAVGLPGNDLTIHAGNSSISHIAAAGGNLLLVGGRSNDANKQNGGHVMLRVGENFSDFGANFGAKPGDIIFYGRNGSSPIEFGRMDGDTGNWGFGKSPSTARVDVNGTVKATGLQLTTGAATGLVLTSDPNGVASWTNVASLGFSETDPQVGDNTMSRLSKWDGTALISSGVTETGSNVGIGVAEPHASLHLLPILNNRRIVVWEDGDNDHQFYGFGINPGTLRYQVPATTADHIFYAGQNAGASVEIMRIEGSGNVSIGGGDAGARLDVKGTAKLGELGSVLNNVIRRQLVTQNIAISPNATSGITFTNITGATEGSTVFVSPSVALPAGVSIGYSLVSANGQVSVAFVNGTNVIAAIPAMTLYVTIIN